VRLTRSLNRLYTGPLLTCWLHKLSTLTIGPLYLHFLCPDSYRRLHTGAFFLPLVLKCYLLSILSNLQSPILVHFPHGTCDSKVTFYRYLSWPSKCRFLKVGSPNFFDECCITGASTWQFTLDMCLLNVPENKDLKAMLHYNKNEISAGCGGSHL
jgi:hypothetical protein